MPILPADRDPRLITVRRGGSLMDEHHRLLAAWALDCAEHVLPLFDAESDDPGPRRAIEVGRAWVRGEVPMRTAHQAAFTANAAGRGLPDPARFAALAAGRIAERDRQRDALPSAVRDLVLEDQVARSPVCWHAFD